MCSKAVTARRSNGGPIDRRRCQSAASGPPVRCGLKPPSYDELVEAVRCGNQVVRRASHNSRGYASNAEPRRGSTAASVEA